MNYFDLLSPAAPLSIAGKQSFIANDRLPRKYSCIFASKTGWNFVCLQSCFVDMLMFHHLGQAPLVPQKEIVEQALMNIREFYQTAWFINDPDEFKCMQKERANRHLVWYEFFVSAFLVALLAEDESTLESVADYPESWFTPESMAIPIDPSLGHIYISVAAAFRSEPLDGQAEMENSIRKNRKQAPKLLFSAWEAARIGNQSQFEERLRSSVLLFEKQLPLVLCSEDELIAFPQSTILAAARRLGMQLPNFEPRIMARLLTSESVGLK